MNTKLLLLAVALVTLASCSSVYKSGQTPDDVYYSPVRYTEGAAVAETRRDYGNDQYSTYEDRQIRMGIGSPRYRYLDYDYYDMSYNPYRYGYSYGYYYNPFYCYYPVYNPVVVTPSNPKVTTPRMTNLAGYGNSYNNGNITVNPKTGYAYPSAPVRSYNNGNYNTSRLGNTLNKVFNNNNSSSNYNNSNNSNYNNSSNTSSNRSYSPSTNNNSSSSSSRSASSSSSSSSSSSGSSTSRPVRNGKG